MKGLRRLTTLSHTIDDILNRAPYARAPYVGQQSFAHKGGLHGSAIAKKTSTYEHIDPSDVGNERQLIVSQQAGRSIMKSRLDQMGIDDINPARLDEFIDLVKSREHEGYTYDGAAASFEMLARKNFGLYKPFYKVLRYQVVDDYHYEEPSDHEMWCNARMVFLCGSQISWSDSGAQGPVHALYKCLHSGLIKVYESVKQIKLEDYKVRIVNAEAQTQARTRVAIAFRDEDGNHWETVGVSVSIIRSQF